RAAQNRAHRAGHAENPVRKDHEARPRSHLEHSRHGRHYDARQSGRGGTDSAVGPGQRESRDQRRTRGSQAVRKGGVTAATSTRQTIWGLWYFLASKRAVKWAELAARTPHSCAAGRAGEPRAAFFLQNLVSGAPGLELSSISLDIPANSERLSPQRNAWTLANAPAVEGRASPSTVLRRFDERSPLP